MGFGCWGFGPAHGIYLLALQKCCLCGGDGHTCPAGPAKGAPARATQNLCLGVDAASRQGPEGGGVREGSSCPGRTRSQPRLLEQALPSFANTEA